MTLLTEQKFDRTMKSLIDVIGLLSKQILVTADTLNKEMDKIQAGIEDIKRLAKEADEDLPA